MTGDHAHSMPSSRRRMHPAATTMQDPAAPRAPVIPSFARARLDMCFPYRIQRAKGLPPNWHLFYTISGRGLFRQKAGLERATVVGDIVLLGPTCEHDYGCVPE